MMKSVLEICRTCSPCRRGLCGQRGWDGQRGWGDQRGWGGAYRGVGELFILLLLAGVAGIALLVYAQAEREDLRHDQALATGKLVGTWLRYAHLYAQDNQQHLYAQDPQDPAVMSDREVIPQIIKPTRLKPGYAPEWLQETTGPNDSIILGIIDDGVPRTGSTPRTGIPMAFVIWNRTTGEASDLLPVDFRDSVAQGLSLAEGLNAEQFATITGVTDRGAQGASAAQGIGLTLTHRAKIETLLGETNHPFLDDGRMLPFGTIIATADSAIAYNADALYRRRQPGHPELNRMLGDIKLDGNNYTARTIAITRGNVNGVTVKETAGPTEFNNLYVGRSVTANKLNLDRVKGEELESDHMVMTYPTRGRTLITLFVETLDTNTLSGTGNIVAEEGSFKTIEVEDGTFTTLDIQNQNPSPSSDKYDFEAIIGDAKTTASNVWATIIKGGTTPSWCPPSGPGGTTPSGGCPGPGELITTNSNSFTTDKLYTQRPDIVKTP